MQHRAPAAPLVPRGKPPPASLLQRRENLNLNQAPSHLSSQQFSDDPYAFHPSEYIEHASPEGEVEEELENEENAFPSPSPEESDKEEEDNEEEESGEEDFEAVSEGEEEVAVQGDDSASEWEPSSESDGPEEDVPAAAARKKQGVTMIQQNKRTAQKSATAATKTFSRKSNLVSGPDSSFAIHLSDHMTTTANTGGATTSKATNQQQQQQQNQVSAPVPTSAPAIPAPPTAPDAVNKVKNKNKKLTFADQAALPLMIPKSVAREPAGTAILIELPHGVELAGASGVVGRILKSSGGNGRSGGASGSRDASHSSGIVLDLMGTLLFYKEEKRKLILFIYSIGVNFLILTLSK